MRTCHLFFLFILPRESSFKEDVSQPPINSITVFDTPTHLLSLFCLFPAISCLLLVFLCEEKSVTPRQWQSENASSHRGSGGNAFCTHLTRELHTLMYLFIQWYIYSVGVVHRGRVVVFEACCVITSVTEVYVHTSDRMGRVKGPRCLYASI